MASFIHVAIALVVVIVGVLIMTQVLDLEQVDAAIWRMARFLWAVIVPGFIFRLLLLPILICVLVWLKTEIVAALVIVMLAIPLLLLKIALSKAMNGANTQERG